MKSFLISILLFGTVFMEASAQTGSTAQLIEVAQFGNYQPIGVAVSHRGRIFVTFPYRQPYQYGLAELVNGQKQPYPDAGWNLHDTLQPQNHLMNVQALWIDTQDNLWILDPANAGPSGTIGAGVKLIKVNLATNKVEHIYRFEDLHPEQTALNDVRIDTHRQLAYLSDPRLAAVVVLDLKTGKSRTVLKNSIYTKADPEFKLHIDGKDVVDGQGKPFSSAVNGIALPHDFKYFYFRAINQTKLYRIGTQYLADVNLTDEQLASHVEDMGETGISHGIIADEKGNIYLSDSPDKAIRYLAPDGKMKVLVQDDRLIWPDSFAIGPDGYLYVTCSQINRTPKYNNGEDRVAYPFRLYKVKLP